MKTIIAGGRDYFFTDEDETKLDNLRSQISEVVSGGAKGADSCGERWARENDIPIKMFPADWKKYDKAAGPIRNEQMARYADAVILFPGGSGTKNMYETAKRYGLKIWDFRKT